MTRRTLVLVGGLALVAAVALPGSGAQAQGQSRPGSSAFVTPWGDPDIQGLFTTDDELGVPFERPEQAGAREVVTDQEFADRQAQASRQAATDAEEFVVPSTGRGGGGTGPPGHWLERGKPSRRTSIVIDPPNGRIPFLNDEARKRAAVAVNARTSGSRPFDGPEALDLYDRCITRGMPHVIFPTIYNNTLQIVQGPGYVAIRYEMIHDARVIPLDPSTGSASPRPFDAVQGRPEPADGRAESKGDGHLLAPSQLRQYMGISRGRWEGDTLVVEVTNFPTNIVNYRGATGALHVTERFRRVDASTVRYEVTVSDPATFARPWTAAIDLKSSTQPDVFEYACHEGNYAMRNILSAARAAEKAGASGR
jgi:hypothetical protein